MTIFQSIILGIVQGIAEFLPVSSSAHLILVPWVLGWDDGGLTFDVALHAGTLIALVVYFAREWMELAKGLLRIRPAHLKNPELLDRDVNAKIALFVIVATIPGAIMGLLLEKKAEHAFRDPRLIAINLAVIGVVLWLADKNGRKNKGLDQMNLRQSFLIGIAQGFAVIPGVSRSGITISTALAQGYDRLSSARFSFFLSMPIIAGACVLKLRHLTSADITPAFMAGVAASTIAGFLAISGLIKFLQTRSYTVFAVYRFLIALAVFALVYSRGVH